MLSQARYQDAKAAAETAYRILARALGKDHPESIRALVALSLVQEVLREDANAMSNVRDAIAMIGTRYGQDDARIIRPLHILGSLLSRQRSFEEARATLERGADIARRRVGPRSGSLANLLTLRGEMERAAGDPATALVFLEQAEQAMPDDEILGRAQLHSIRGSVHFERGDGELAEQDFREVLRLRDNTSEPRNSRSWFAQAQLGDALALQGRFDEAHRLQQEAAENMRMQIGPDAYQNTLVLTRRAGTYAMQGDWKNSVVHTREAIRVLGKTYDGDHPNHFLWNLDLASALSRLPEGREEAARIADTLIAEWSDDERVARNQPRLLLLRCGLHLAAGEADAARVLADATLARPELALQAEERSALKRCAAGDYEPYRFLFKAIGEKR
jgi:tetratricopeptide (TPR) repeat protein